MRANQLLPGPKRIECIGIAFADKYHCASKLRRGQYLVYMETTMQIELDAICDALKFTNRMGEIFPG